MKVIDGDGTSKYIKTLGDGTTSDPYVPERPAKDLMLEIAAGRVSGVSGVNKFGANTAVGNDATEDIWDGQGTYIFPTTADITHISQTSNDAPMYSAVIELQGLDENWELTVQTKALHFSDTTTLIELDTPLIRVFRMKVLADVVAAEDISATNSAGTSSYAKMLAGNNQTFMAIYTVPAGKTAYMTDYYADYVRTPARDPDSVEYHLFVADRLNGYEFQAKHAKGIPKQAPGFEHHFKPYMKVGERSDIKITATANNSSAHVHAGFNLVLEDN